MPWTNDVADARRLQAIDSTLTAFFADDAATEVQINPQDGAVWIDTWGRGLERQLYTVPAARLERFLNVVASAMGVEFKPTSPVLAGELPDAPPFGGARLQAFMPPVTPGVSVIIRKRPTRAVALDDYVRDGGLTPERRAVIGRYVDRTLDHEPATFLIAGQTGSGKTTFASALLREISVRCPRDRIVMLEDTSELICPVANYLPLRATPELPFAALVKHTLRASPTRVVLGEVRDAAALDFLTASSTGHPGGLCTMHAGTVPEALDRLAFMAESAPNVAAHFNAARLIGQVAPLVVILGSGTRKRQVVDLVKVSGFTKEAGFSLHSC